MPRFGDRGLSRAASQTWAWEGAFCADLCSFLVICRENTKVAERGALFEPSSMCIHAGVELFLDFLLGGGRCLPFGGVAVLEVLVQGSRGSCGEDAALEGLPEPIFLDAPGGQAQKAPPRLQEHLG